MDAVTDHSQLLQLVHMPDLCGFIHLIKLLGGRHLLQTKNIYFVTNCPLIVVYLFTVI